MSYFGPVFAAIIRGAEPGAGPSNLPGVHREFESRALLHTVALPRLPSVLAGAGIAAAKKVDFGKTTPPWLTRHPSHLRTIPKTRLITLARAQRALGLCRSISSHRSKTCTPARAPGEHRL